MKSVVRAISIILIYEVVKDSVRTMKRQKKEKEMRDRKVIIVNSVFGQGRRI